MPSSSRFAGLGWLPAVLWGAAFALAYVQPSLYYSNQNQYFLHGLAANGRGELAHDWLAGTRDPTPVFSAAVGWMDAHLGEWSFYAAYGIILGVYFVSLVALMDATIGLPRTPAARFVFLTLTVIIVAAGTRWVVLRFAGIDVPRYLHYGLAGQYILGPGLQPSVFGVLLVTSLAAFARGRFIAAAVAIAAACTLHATYLLPAALITTAYMVVLARDGRLRSALMLGGGILVAVLPIVVFGLVAFAPTTPEQFNQAQHLLATERIPHHCVFADWWDRSAELQVLWIAMAIILSFRTRLFPLLAIPTFGGLVLTLIQVKSGSTALALIFPWRISAVIVPVATAVIVVRAVNFLTPYLGRWSVIGAGVLLAGAVLGGVYLSQPGLAYPADELEWPLLNFVRENRRPGDVYLIPVVLPKNGGSLGGSMTLRPTGEIKVPVELQRFRLMTGTPVYVDFKAIPYLDVEVLEWNRRLQLCQGWYEFGDWSKLIDALRNEGITHLVVSADHQGKMTGLESVHVDRAYRVYRLPKRVAARN